MDTRKRLEKVLTTALGQSFEECPNAKKVVIQQTLLKGVLNSYNKGNS